MSKKLKLTAIGNSTGLILPKEILERMRVGRGGEVFIMETANGYEVTPFDPEFAAQLEVAEEVMREDRDLLRKLAE